MKPLQKALAFLVIAPIIAVGIFPAPFRTLVDSFSYPWAHSMGGRPTLTGSWKGDLRIGGQVYPLTLEIERKPLKSHRKGTRGRYPRRGGFTGTAQWTDAAGQPHRYDLSGRANRSGSEVSLHLTSTGRPSSPELQPVVQDLAGVWQGGSLRLSGAATFGIFNQGTETYPSDSPTLPAAADLEKG